MPGTRVQPATDHRAGRVFRAPAPINRGRPPTGRRYRTSIALLLCGALGMATPALGEDGPRSGKLLIRGVTVVDTATGRRSADMAVEVVDGRIVRIARTETIKQTGFRVVDARRKFVVPGYLDMHAHPLDSPDPAGSLTLMLANGITGFRQMSGSPALLSARRANTLGLSDGTPQLLAMPGTILTPMNAATPMAAQAEVDRQKQQGADFIKVVQVDEPTFKAVAASAKRDNLPFLGHLPPSVPVAEAAAAGMHSIEHLGPNGALLLSCSSDEAGLRAAMARMPAGVPPSGVRPLAASQAPPPVPAGPPIAIRTLVNPTLQIPPAGFIGLARTLASYDEGRCTGVARMLAADQTWQVPTLLRLRTMEYGDAAEYRQDPNLRYVPREARALWSDVADDFAKRQTPQTRATFAQLFTTQLKLVKLFDREHVPMMTGTDFGGGWEVAGVGLHQEFDLLAQAGLSPLTILQMTTLNGARFLGRQATMGSVAVGRQADLVLLDADPVASVAALHRISGVVRAGRYYSAAELTAMKAAVAAKNQ